MLEITILVIVAIAGYAVFRQRQSNTPENKAGGSKTRLKHK